jgi:predicted transcriptional regulator
MARHRAIIEIPPELAGELDRLAGRGNRSSFAADVLQREVPPAAPA